MTSCNNAHGYSMLLLSLLEDNSMVLLCFAIFFPSHLLGTVLFSMTSYSVYLDDIIVYTAYAGHWIGVHSACSGVTHVESGKMWIQKSYCYLLWEAGKSRSSAPHRRWSCSHQKPSSLRELIRRFRDIAVFCFCSDCHSSFNQSPRDKSRVVVFSSAGQLLPSCSLQTCCFPLYLHSNQYKEPITILLLPD